MATAVGPPVVVSSASSGVVCQYQAHVASATSGYTHIPPGTYKQVHAFHFAHSELRSCVTVEAAFLGSRS